MIAIALVVFIVSILYVMVWSMKNENARSIQDQTGLIKMRPASPARKHTDKNQGTQSSSSQDGTAKSRPSR